MSKQKANVCDLLISCIVGDCNVLEHQIFQEHLLSCDSCQLEWRDLSIIWSYLAFDMQIIIVPNNLKKKIMQAIINPV